MGLVRDNTQFSAVLGTVLGNLRAKAAELGLTLTAWDAAGNLTEPPTSCHAFCRMLSATECPCDRARTGLARSVLNSGQPSHETSPWGCCFLGIPVYDHRRLVGAVVLEYPSRDMLDEERLAHLCDRYQLDLQVMRGYAEKACRHSAGDAANLQRMFTALLADQQQIQDAGQALTSLSVSLASAYEELSLLYRISGSMKVSQDTKTFLQTICDDLGDVVNVEVAAAIVYSGSTRKEQDLIVQTGLAEALHQPLRLLAATYVLPRLTDESNPLLENHAQRLHRPLGPLRVRNLLAAPLIIDHQNVGLLMGLNKREGDFNSYEAKLMGSIASQASVFLANHRMYAELQDLLIGMLQSLTESVDAKDPYTCGHSRRVAEIARRLAVACGFDAQRVQQIYFAGLLHDIGKIGISDAILCKDGRLTGEEYEAMKRHPSIGAKILRRIRHLEPILAGVLSHHERIDGKGYPQGIQGMEIPIEGRILCLADSWDAMTSHRTYRRAMSVPRAMQEIRDCSGTQFDPVLVEHLLSWDLEAFMEELRGLDATDLHILDERIL